MLGRIGEIYRNGGAGAVARRGFSSAHYRAWRRFSAAYKGLRPLLPTTTPIRYAGQVIGHRKLGDAIALDMPPEIYDVPDYEDALIQGLNRHVRIGDRVTVIGGGFGVTCAVAARLSKSKVLCYEGDLAGVRSSQKTAELNGVEVETIHAIVGSNIFVYGNEHAATVVAPSELPECDVLELDCEGAEVQILSEMKIKPRAVVVETHGCYGAPTDKVQAILESRGYRVENLGWAESYKEDACRKGGIEVLVGS
jgi:hypothetical protein